MPIVPYYLGRPARTYINAMTRRRGNRADYEVVDARSAVAACQAETAREWETAPAVRTRGSRARDSEALEASVPGI
jgi:hypothetical protein